MIYIKFNVSYRPLPNSEIKNFDVIKKQWKIPSVWSLWYPTTSNLSQVLKQDSDP